MGKVHDELVKPVVLTWKDDGGRTIHGPGSNFWVEPDKTNVEAEFQLEKDRDLNPFMRNALLRKFGTRPGAAKKWGRAIPMSRRELAAWDRRKVKVMERLVRQKLDDNPDVQDWLLSTGEAKIVETNWWHDQFWGDCQCREHFFRVGQNHLGKIWMALREELRASA